ncbi:MAG: methyltransferase domain-containing protein [Deltaproteobacteria bacterium]|nr:methyltransferase domain-containing protein [Deltaproteobacteria bacterium]
MLDAGCGTGRLSLELKREYPGSTVVGCDFALPMLIEAQRTDASKRLVVADVDAMPFPSGIFDLVASNLAYQWPPDTLASFQEAGRVLKQGGLFALSTLGPQTLFEMREACRHAAMPTAQMNFLRPDEVDGILAGAGFSVITIDRQTFTREYADMRALLRALRNIGAMPHPAASAGALITGVLLKKAGRIYRERFPGPSNGITATYDVIFAAARKG